MRRHFSPKAAGRLHQRGYALLLMLVLVTMGLLFSIVSQVSQVGMKWARAQDAGVALLEAKEALIGDSVSQTPVAFAGDLRLPDLGFSSGSTLTEGSPPQLNFSGNCQNCSVIGKIPWKILGIPPLRDEYGECLWYVVSGRFKNNQPTSVLNWDTQGQIDVVDGKGDVVATNLAALIVAPGQILDGQNRALADPTYAQCGGNYDVRNYLDSYDASNAASGQLNYFAGSTNNRVAPDSNNKQFVMTNGDHYNDRFLYVTADDIFRPIIRRSDFREQIAALLDDMDLRKQVETGHPETVVPSGSGTKGANNVSCGAITNPNNQTFCKNWKEMLLLTQLSPHASITINGAPTPLCSRVLIFAGQKTGAQIRNSAADKSDITNYLEGPNIAAFNTNSANFVGSFTFDWNNPSADLMRCL